MALPEIFNRFPAIAMLCLSLACIATGVFVQIWGIKAGVYYLHGTPVYRQSEPSQFWSVFVIYSGLPLIIGLFILSLFFRK